MSYQCTDDRTSSALDCYRKGYGRCGEESVFAVNALRSVGIPARQVYAPKWSHCDDNHAWVEAWCGGKWHYFGACEPRPVLDQGWFRNAASRAMMVHSRSVESYHDGDNIVGRDGITLVENQLARYAKTKKIKIRVEDRDGDSVHGAEILQRCLIIRNFHLLRSCQQVRTDVRNWKQDLEVCIFWQFMAANRGMLDRYPV